MYKLRNITDNIHGTIHLSEYEYIMTSTPFFYRLHDVYQSSTVYMTFPANRTKRYEHSLGTMHISGTMLHAALSNADNETRQKFIESMKDEANAFSTEWKNADIRTYFAYLATDIYPSIYEFFQSQNAFFDSDFQHFELDKALIKQLPCADFSNDKKTQFYLQSALQALRLAALFHDVGHPPYSHIVEYLFQELKAEDFSDASFDKVKVDSLTRILNQHGSNEDAFHEDVGKTMTNLAFSQATRQLYQTEQTTEATVSNVYNTFVAWLTTRILAEESPFTKSLHHFIDGPIDADRLDYIIRDTRNSGIDWGRLPYECILNSIKLVTYNGSLEFAFPHKISDTLDEILLNRYKIFSRINSHHRTVKSAKLLQLAIKKLVIDFLKRDKCIVPEISNLWKTLQIGLSPDLNSRKIAAWNDSWLMSVLQTALGNLANMRGQRTKEEEEIFHILEELILNKKSYYSLLKRGQDAKLLANKILQKSGLTWPEIVEKLESVHQNPELNRDLMSIISQINVIEQFEKTGNFSLLYLMISEENPDAHIDVLKTCISQVSSECNQISDYIVDKNKGYDKTGLEGDGNILLYDTSRGAVYEYDTENLNAKLALEQNSTLSVNIYVQLQETNNPEEVLNTILDKIIDTFAKILKSYFDEFIFS